MPTPPPPLQGPLWPANKLTENLLRVDARKLAPSPVGCRAEPQTRIVEVGSITATVECLSSSSWFRCPACDRLCRYIYIGDSYGCFVCLGLDYSVRHVDRKWSDLRMANKLRAMLGAGPFPEPLPPISVYNQKKQRIVARIRVAETRLITRFQSANQALARFAKAKTRAKSTSRAAPTSETPRSNQTKTGHKLSKPVKPGQARDTDSRDRLY